jgi:hypothetical protein
LNKVIRRPHSLNKRRSLIYPSPSLSVCHSRPQIRFVSLSSYGRIGRNAPVILHDSCRQQHSDPPGHIQAGNTSGSWNHRHKQTDIRRNCGDRKECSFLIMRVKKPVMRLSLFFVSQHGQRQNYFLGDWCPACLAPIQRLGMDFEQVSHIIAATDFSAQTGIKSMARHNGCNMSSVGIGVKKISSLDFR